MCRICLFKELPFDNSEAKYDQLIVNQSLNVTYPSQVSDNRFNVFKRKGLHFVHINAGSMFNKLSELRYFASVHNPAGLSITETWTNKSHTDASINIDVYNLV